MAARPALVARYRAMDENTFSALALIALVAVIAPLLSEAIGAADCASVRDRSSSPSTQIGTARSSRRR